MLHNALNYAVRIGYIGRNPTDAIDRPRNDTEERPVYTPEQVRRLMVAADGDRLQGCGTSCCPPGCDGPSWPG